MTRGDDGRSELSAADDDDGGGERTRSSMEVSRAMRRIDSAVVEAAEQAEPLQPTDTEEDVDLQIVRSAPSGDTNSASAKYDDDKEDLNLELVALAGNIASGGPRRIPPDVLTQRSLAKDTFSFLVFSRWCSGPYLLATIVYGLQVAIFVLVSADVIDLDNEGNPFNIPPNVELPVRITEVLAITVGVITQDDVRKAINLLRDGYDDAKFRGAFGDGVAKSKWAMSVALRGSEGLLGLFVTFLLIMQSDTVLDLLLNFSAMEFVSLIDDVVFALTTEGFFGRKLKGEAKSLSSIKYHIGHPTNARVSSLVTVAYFVVLFAAMLLGWGIIFAKQDSGQYLCRQLYVQLDDDFIPYLGPLSGMYSVNLHFKFSSRVAYFNAGVMIAYCEMEKRWTLTVPFRRGSTAVRIWDPCEHWVAASSESVDFDVTDTASWYARTDSGRVLPLQQSYFHCYDCQYQSDFCGETASHGTCTENRCVCADGRYGLRCEFETPCSALEVDPRSQGFVGNRTFASIFYLLDGAGLYPTHVESYSQARHRPIYTSNLQDAGDIDILLFTGRRWVLSSAMDMAGLADLADSVEGVNDTTADRVKTLRMKWYLGSVFNGYFSSYNVSFISEAVDVDTRADMTASPLGLTWHAALLPIEGNVQGPDLGHSVDVSLICATE